MPLGLIRVLGGAADRRILGLTLNVFEQFSCSPVAFALS